jgi:hypothetical protein
MSALGDGTPYTFSVVATNALGGSTAATSNAVTPGQSSSGPAPGTSPPPTGSPTRG